MTKKIISNESRFWINIYFNNEIVTTIYDIEEIRYGNDDDKKCRIFSGGNMIAIIEEGTLLQIDAYRWNIYLDTTDK